MSHMTNGKYSICAFPHILGSPSSYMTLQLLHSEFPSIGGKFSFLFYQCVDDYNAADDWLPAAALADPGDDVAAG
jgi:hypothetical protein